MKNSSDTLGNRTRDLAACSEVRQPTATAYPTVSSSTPVIFMFIVVNTTRVIRSEGPGIINHSSCDM